MSTRDLSWQSQVGASRVDRLIKAGLKARMGIHGIIGLYDRAAESLYHPNGYEEKDVLRAILFWRLGGARTCEIAHKSLSLPGITYARARRAVPPLLPSPTTLS